MPGASTFGLEQFIEQIAEPLLEHLDLGTTFAPASAAWDSTRPNCRVPAIPASSITRTSRDVRRSRPCAGAPIFVCGSRSARPRRRSNPRAKAAAGAKAKAEQEAEEKRQAEGRKKSGKKARAPSGAPEAEAQRNFTDPDSRILRTKDGCIQGYNAQATVDASAQIAVAYELAPCMSDRGQSSGKP